MPADVFQEHIRTAIADRNLQEALDLNAERRLIAREQAYLSLPEPWEVMRQRAHTVRAKVITNLDHYLDQFTTQAQLNGMTVHYAANADEANQIVLDIAKENTAELIAKSKTMLSEEIGLNQCLESEGLRVVETDLGEFIVQLRGEPPAHIITPSVHLRRKEVGQTFHDKLNIPYTEDITNLTSAARKVLRQVFLEADIGISGVNFGVADTGTICILTNEGNGRMVTSVPPIHIALMGLERLVPTLDDLALMLYLLPRSATGQKITVYTSLIQKPVSYDAPSTSFGPRERHLILVDNGRTKLRYSSLAEVLYCIRCGSCLNACPVFQEIGGHAYVNKHGESSTYQGPIGSVVSPGLFGGSDFGHLARASSLCGACKEACPVDIDLPKLLLRIRAGETPDNHRPASNESRPPNIRNYLYWGLRFYTWVAIKPKRFAFVQKLSNAFGSLAPDWLGLPAFTGWGYSKDFPGPPRESFRKHWEKSLSSGGKQIHEEGETNKDSAYHESNQEISPIVGQNLETARSAASTQHTSKQLLAQFKGELTALDGRFIHCKASDLPEIVLNLLEEKGIDHILAWEKDHLPEGLVQEVNAAGIEVQSNPSFEDIKAREEIHAKDPQPTAGITGAIAAIAETGTLVLTSDHGRSPAASLIPDIHIAIFNIQDLYPNLSSVFQLEEILHSPSTTLISGPSRTADIEMTLTIGVHGPKEVYVICVGDQPE